MAEEIVKKLRTKKDLLEADPDTLTNDELDRRGKFIEIDSREASLELAKHENAKHKMKQQEIKDKYTSRGRELKKTDRDHEIQQSNCPHRKGGSDGSGHGTDAMHSVLRHLMPWNEIYQRCLRCGKTWRPPHIENYPETPEGKKDFDAAMAEYKAALAWPTDNKMSTSITYQFTSDDGNVSAKKFVHETVKDTDLR